MPLTHFWLIRHGETQWNADRRLQGWQDTPLNANGLAQAEQLRAYLSSPQFEPKVTAVVSSDLSRAADTARIATPHLGLPVQLTPGLRERCFGQLEGMHWDAIQSARRGDPAYAPLPEASGETRPVFQARLIKVFEELAREHAGGHVLTFSHGGVIDMMWRKLADIALDAPRDHPILNASINHFTIDADRQWAMVEWGRVAHLPALGTALDDVG